MRLRAEMDRRIFGMQKSSYFLHTVRLEKVEAMSEVSLTGRCVVFTTAVFSNYFFSSKCN